MHIVYIIYTHIPTHTCINKNHSNKEPHTKYSCTPQVHTNNIYMYIPSCIIYTTVNSQHTLKLINTPFTLISPYIKTCMHIITLYTYIIHREREHGNHVAG